MPIVPLIALRSGTQSSEKEEVKAGGEFGKRKTGTGAQRGAGRETDLALVGGLQKQLGGSGGMSCSWQDVLAPSGW